MGKIVSAIRLLFFLSRTSTRTHLISRSTSKIRKDEEHLKAAIQWIKTAHDNSVDDGVPGGWSPTDGWLSSYPQTTGAIIETLIEFARSFSDNDARDRAIRMGEWEIDIQLPSGAVHGGTGTTPYPIVFYTGQVIRGWVALYKDTGDHRFLDASIRAAEWLQKIQDEDGCWRHHTSNDVPHAYNSCAAWAMLAVSAQALRLDLRTAAKKNIEWVLSCVDENGWIEYMEIEPGVPPSTSSVASTLRGLLEAAAYLPNLAPAIIDKVYKASQLIIVNSFTEDLTSSKLTFMPGTLHRNWQSKDKYICLTGNAELAIVFLKLTQFVDDDRLVLAANHLINQVKVSQCTRHCSKKVKGGVAGSFPVWGGYLKHQYPSGAAKSFADALMLRMIDTKDN